MGSPIVRLEGKLLVWSTISDSPMTFGLTLPELQEYVREEHGREGLHLLDARLQRVHTKGTSSFDDKDAEATIWLNRADRTRRGTERPLHVEEIVEFYVRRRCEPSKDALTAFRKDLEKCGPTCVAIERNGCGSHCRKCWGTGYVRPEKKSWWK